MLVASEDAVVAADGCKLAAVDVRSRLIGELLTPLWLKGAMGAAGPVCDGGTPCASAAEFVMRKMQATRKVTYWCVRNARFCVLFNLRFQM